MDKITVQGIQFFGRHGVTPAEREVGQRFVVDVELRLDLARSAAGDRLEDTVDYVAVHDLVREVGRGAPAALLETLADRIARAVLGRFGPKEVTVRVRKPAPPIDGALDWVGVEITRS
jgi:7,8-dihydroneopterin aldolase/epimerase/oxygenase